MYVYFTLLFIQNICSTHLKYYVENKLKQTADAFDDHYDQTEVQSILAWLNNFIGCLTNQSEMIDKSESIYWANVWWIFVADNYYLTFEEVKWVISEKSILQTDFEGEKPARIYTVRGNNNILH